MNTVETPVEESAPAPATPAPKVAPAKAAARQTPAPITSREELVALTLKEFQAPPVKEPPPAPAQEPTTGAQVETGTPAEAASAEPGEAEQQAEPAEEREPEWPDSAKAAISEVRAKARALKEELKLLKDQQAARTEEGKPAKPAADRETKADAAEAVPEVQRLMQLERNASEATRRVEKLLNRVQRGDVEGVVKTLKESEGITLPADVSDEQLTDYLLDLRHNATEHMRHAAIKAEVEKQRARDRMAVLEREFRQKADKLFPWQKAEGETVEHRHAAEVKARFPAILQLPDGGYWLGVVVEGLKAVETRERATATPAARPKAAPSNAPKPSVSPQTGVGTGDTADLLLKRYQETGDPKDREAWMKAEMAGARKGT